MAESKVPLFSGLLEHEKWKTDSAIMRWLDAGLVRIVENRGFVITHKGVKHVRAHGLQVNASASANPATQAKGLEG